MAEKPKIAFTWLAGCGGCEESIIDLGETLVTVSRKADIVFWPVALDARYRDIAALGDGEIDVAFINGAVRLEAHVALARLLRRKSRQIIAHGTCAHMGGVVGLGNGFTVPQLLSRCYREVPSMEPSTGPLPGEGAGAGAKGPPLPPLLPRVESLDRVIAVDATIPGCPPPPETMARVIFDIIDGRLPQPGTVYADRKALCHQCPRLASKPPKIEIQRFERLYDTQWDPEICFLPQGLICLGPVTRGGCGARCIGANMPCRGCFGPVEQGQDFGARAISLIAATMAGDDEAALSQAVDSIADPAGLFHRYCLATSILGNRAKGHGP